MTRLTRIFAALWLLTASSALAQTGTVMPAPKFTGFDNNGQIINAGRLCTYAAGTTTPQATYSDVGLTTPNTNPIILDPAGRATVFLSTTSYKFVLRAASSAAITGVTSVDCAASAALWTQDNVSAVPTSAASVDVIGTTGEALTAGQCAYLSDGSGSKTQGQWYKCDTGNIYSATANWVGLAPANIANPGSGTIRLAGQVTGLSSLTVGATYYAGAAGAITATAPANARKLGEADSATTLILTGNPPSSTAIGFVDDLRLSLTTATCATSADVTAATTLFLTPCTGNRMTLFDAAGNVATYTTAEISIAVPATTTQMYDVFVFASSGTPTMELLAWTNDTTRATAITRTSGSNWRWTKSGDTTRLYVGSFRTTAVSGQTEDSAANRFVYNYYNAAPRTLGKYNTGNYTYTTATWREAAGSTTHRVNFVIGVAERAVKLEATNLGSNATINVVVGCAIGLDATTAPTPANQRMSINGVGAAETITGVAAVETIAAVGFHFASLLEYSTAAGTTTWYDNANVTGQQAGIGGMIWN